MGPRLRVCKKKLDKINSELTTIQKKHLKQLPKMTDRAKNTPASPTKKQLCPVLVELFPVLPLTTTPVPATFIPNREAFEQKYRLGSEIGSGGFGTVFDAVRVSDNRMVAIKIMRLETVKPRTRVSVSNLPKRKSIPTEVVLLQKCQSVDGVIRLIEYIQSDQEAFIVMERDTDFVDLFDFISDKKRLSHSTAQHVIRQITRILAQFQSIGVIHRDLKQENVLIHHQNGNIKLLDFGLAQIITESNQKFNYFKGTAIYKPPEHIRSKETFADSLTVWSIGCFSYSLFFGDVPFKNDDEISAGKFPEGDLGKLSPVSRDFILQCTQPNPKSRPLLQDLLNHPWISSTSGPPAPATKQSISVATPRCSYEVVEVGERPSTSTSTTSSTSSNVENVESKDPRIYMKLRRTVNK